MDGSSPHRYFVKEDKGFKFTESQTVIVAGGRSPFPPFFLLTLIQVNFTCRLMNLSSGTIKCLSH